MATINQNFWKLACEVMISAKIYYQQKGTDNIGCIIVGCKRLQFNPKMTPKIDISIRLQLILIYLP